MTRRIIWRIVNRSAHFGFVGFFWMLMIGLVEGVATGGVLAIVMTLASAPSGAGDGATVFLGMMVGAAVAMCVGALTGAIALGLVGALTARRNDEGQVFTRATNWAARGSAVGVLVGAASGTTGAALLALALNRNFGAVIGGYLFSGYILGVIGGFVVGTFAGAIYGALNENESPMPGIEWLLRRQ